MNVLFYGRAFSQLVFQLYVKQVKSSARQKCLNRHWHSLEFSIFGNIRLLHAYTPMTTMKLWLISLKSCIIGTRTAPSTLPLTVVQHLMSDAPMMAIVVI